jgi:DNA uptake protein ComE-like DNA-binding protein
MWRTLIFVAPLFAGCAEPAAPLAQAGDPVLGRIEEGSPEAVGVIGLLNDASTTLTVLDVDAKLDARAAQNLIAHRDGPDARFGTADDDRFDTIAEIDAVSYVGDSALQALVGYAQANGWIPAGDDFYGIVEGLSLTRSQADAALRTANEESQVVLDEDVGLDSRAAAGIVAGRPFADLETVAAVSYVGPSAIQALVDYGTAVTLDAATAKAELDAAVDGMYFSSESDYPLTTWTLATSATPITSSNVRSVLAPIDPGLAGLSVQTSSMSWFFDRNTVAKDWWDQSYYDAQPEWQAVRDIFEEDLLEPQVFRFGRRNGEGDLVGAIKVFVFGRSADGQLVGFWTVSVET